MAKISKQDIDYIFENIDKYDLESYFTLIWKNEDKTI